ncbi:UDP-N-acetylmuramate--L-alanine ligase [Candidatus Woesebacteria bacterium]|nr:UDP-N-acetylmuramate--L-alanine ligase [Candidatus Woesebacteria bacterium]
MAEYSFQDLVSCTHIHLTGIKGVAMTALAQCLVDLGKTVSGSDVPENFVTSKQLEKLAIDISSGFEPTNVPTTTQLLIYTGAHQGSTNPQVLEAKQRNIPVLSHAQALGLLMDQKKSISVCGTGGKSTTSAMIAWILSIAKTHPSYAVGVGNVTNLDRTGTYETSGEWFVAEADEYAVDPTSDHRPRFIFQHPSIIACTSLNFDHPDIYPTFEDMQRTFQAFFLSAKSVFLNADAPALAAIGKTVQESATNDSTITSVGFAESAIVRLANFSSGPGTTSFELVEKTTSESTPQPITITLQIPGKHNATNAALAYLVCQQLGIASETILLALSQFSGTMRRFEYKGTYTGMRFFDDYAHTPEEITATIQALRAWEPEKRIVVAFQPHTYSRTKALFAGFVDALSLADQLIVLDIFASAREAVDPSVSSQLLVEQILAKRPELDVHLETTPESLSSYIATFSHTPNTVFIALGAGDIYTVFDILAMDAKI